MTSPTASVKLDSSLIHAQHFNISNHTNVNQNSTRSSRRDPIEILQENVAFGALHNSAERFDPPKCHPQTRTAVLDRIDQWARDVSDTAKPILWLTGAAGAGKSAIAQTLVERWNEQDIVTITFFFWRTSAERNQKTHLIPTLAFQLLEHFPSTRSSIEEFIDSGGFFKRNLGFQLQKLIVQPLLSGHKSKPTPVIVVIDGLDECCVDLPKVEGFEGQSYESQQQEMLEAVASACRRAPSLRFMIVSRPERQIRESFGEGILKGCTTSLSLNDVEDADADADVRLFLDCRLEEIRQRHCIDPPWPSKKQVSKLVEKSSGQFIYPSIAVKHISRPRSNPIKSLEAVLEQTGSADNPLTELDMLYSHILQSVASESLSVVIHVLEIIVPPPDSISTAYHFGGVDNDTPLSLEQFLFLARGEIYYHLTGLHSVLDIPSNPKESIKFFHATFSEYLRDRSRSGHFFISDQSIYYCWAFFSLRHVKECIWHKTFDLYNPGLPYNAIFWLPRCLPSEGLLVILWSMMEPDIGPYPQ